MILILYIHSFKRKKDTYLTCSILCSSLTETPKCTFKDCMHSGFHKMWFGMLISVYTKDLNLSTWGGLAECEHQRWLQTWVRRGTETAIVQVAGTTQAWLRLNLSYLDFRHPYVSTCRQWYFHECKPFCLYMQNAEVFLQRNPMSMIGVENCTILICCHHPE